MAFEVKTILKLASAPETTFSEPSELAAAANVTLRTAPQPRHSAPHIYTMTEDGFVLLTAHYENEDAWLNTTADRQVCIDTNECGWNALTRTFVSAVQVD